MAEPRPEDVLRSAVQPLADMARSMSDAARSLAGGGGVSLESMQRWAEQLSSLPRQSVEVLRGIVEEQRQMAELMASWAEQHRELADKLASSAERLRQLSQSGSAVVA